MHDPVAPRLGLHTCPVLERAAALFARARQTPHDDERAELLREAWEQLRGLAQG